MLERDVASTPAQDDARLAGTPAGTPINETSPAMADAVVAAQSACPSEQAKTRWQARMELARHKAETERLRVLVDFLARPIHAHGGADPDPDIVTAYNLAVESALKAVRKAAN